MTRRRASLASLVILTALVLTGCGGINFESMFKGVNYPSIDDLISTFRTAGGTCDPSEVENTYERSSEVTAIYCETDNVWVYYSSHHRVRETVDISQPPGYSVLWGRNWAITGPEDVIVESMTDTMGGSFSEGGIEIPDPMVTPSLSPTMMEP